MAGDGPAVAAAVITTAQLPVYGSGVFSVFAGRASGRPRLQASDQRERQRRFDDEGEENGDDGQRLPCSAVSAPPPLHLSLFSFCFCFLVRFLSVSRAKDSCQSDHFRVTNFRGKNETDELSPPKLSQEDSFTPSGMLSDYNDRQNPL